MRFAVSMDGERKCSSECEVKLVRLARTVPRAERLRTSYDALRPTVNGLFRGPSVVKSALSLWILSYPA